MIDNKYNLGFFPTPIQKLKNLSKEHPDYTIFIKRDDNTGLASGGNKTRKLEYLIKHALDEGFDTIITMGSQQSNHCRQTAAACKIAGLKCHLLLGGNEPETYNGNLLLSSLLGANIHFAGENRTEKELQRLKKKLDSKNNNCYIIPVGGSNITGSLGFVYGVKEIKEQLIEENINIDYIFFASSSGGTQAGLILGKEIYDLKAKLIAISIDKKETDGLFTEDTVLNILKEGAQLLHLDKDFSFSNIHLDRDYNNSGYGILTKDEASVIKKLARTEGILLDPVYTGRAFHGMLDYLKKGKIPKNSNVLFWHTGGLPAIFNYGNELK